MLIFISTSVVVVVSIFNVMGNSGSVAAVGMSVGVTGAVLVVDVLSSVVAVAVAVASEYIKVDAVNLDGIVVFVVVFVVAFVVVAVYVVEVVQYDAVTIRL